MYSRSTREDGSFELQGYVIAGTPGSSNAYIVPIEAIQSSIEAQLGSKLLLPIDLVEKRQVSIHDNLDLSRYSGIPSPPPEVAPAQKVYALLREMLVCQQHKPSSEAQLPQSRKLFAPKPSVESVFVASKLDSASFNVGVHGDYLTARSSTPRRSQSIHKAPSLTDSRSMDSCARYVHCCERRRLC